MAVVASVIGVVSTVSLHSYLYHQLDEQVSNIAMRAAGPKHLPGGLSGKGPLDPQVPGGAQGHGDELAFVTMGSPVGTIGAEVSDGQATEGKISVDRTNASGGKETGTEDLSAGGLRALAAVPRTDKGKATVDLPGLGSYRVEYVSGTNGDYYVGRPTSEVDSTVDALVVTELCVAAAALVAAGVAGAIIVGVNLRPLRRVAATATRVSELPLHSGEVTLYERVPDAEADPGTEVGQVGAALNRMLDHVHGALQSRQQSETRVRQFVADASHELRTPLASIRGYAELTRRGREEQGPDTRHALGRIESEAHRMTGLVEDLLLLARLDAGRPLSYAPTDVSPLVVDALSDARAAGQDHKWRLELPDEPATVHADSARLHQVLVNLFANARTHTPPGTAVTARVHRHGPWVCLDVRDDGPGIPAELLPHVFERFARGDSSRSRKAGSTGLGLAIVQAVAAAHGGAVTVDSVPGRTVFTVHLPLHDEPAGYSQAEQSLTTQR
ncbi:HAMP domain-containing histidine kinase [Streptomyces sp. SID14478]|uniref:HAMP domain-containing sensor histidine kinase n=1 Tax=Streptomyces sp. SID14478 TaxID=2706073 RepID=UPI0013DC0F5B|nr:HAMP domain-containing sensor histidine kinase [Streptomyces sp. SID14478]NEB73828.1 HAMP domain-containing histidine kinase [Streptomyces sp. SID14478]